MFPTIGPFYGNVPINIIGRGFGLKPANQSVSIGGVVCPSTRYISNELLKCDLPPGTGKNQEVTVSFENRKLSGGEIFSYQDGGESTNHEFRYSLLIHHSMLLPSQFSDIRVWHVLQARRSLLYHQL